MMYQDECAHPGKEVTGLPSDEQAWLSFPLEESCQSCFMKPESLYPMFQWNSFPKLSPSAKLQFPHWFHFHIILTFQLMLLFFLLFTAIEICIVILKAWTYCILHVLHTLLNTIEVYLIYFSQESYLCPFYRWGHWGTWNKGYQMLEHIRGHLEGLWIQILDPTPGFLIQEGWGMVWEFAFQSGSQRKLMSMLPFQGPPESQRDGTSCPRPQS